jgi:hypothetical protein
VTWLDWMALGALFLAVVLEMRWFNRDLWPKWWNIFDWRL